MPRLKWILWGAGGSFASWAAYLYGDLASALVVAAMWCLVTGVALAASEY